MKSKSIKLKLVGITSFSIAMILSSCNAFHPVPTMGSTFLTESMDTTNEIRDPVCGEIIEVPEEELMLPYNGDSYYFFTSGCMEEFRADPERYAANRTHNNHHSPNNIMMWGMWGLAAGGMMLLMLL